MSEASAIQSRKSARSARKLRFLHSGSIIIYQVLFIGILFLAWEIAVRQGWLQAYLYGQPSGVYRALINALNDGTIVRHTLVTAQEAFLGFAIGSFLGSLSGLLLWLSPTMSSVLRPLLVALNGVPKIALAPMIVIWFGVGFESKVALAAIMTYIVALIASHSGTKQVDADLIKLMKSLGAARLQIFQKIVVPATMPWVVSAFRLNIGFALIGAVVGEFIAAEEGLGYLIRHSGALYQLNATWLGVFALMFLALVMDYAVAWLERNIISYK